MSNKAIFLHALIPFVILFGLCACIAIATFIRTIPCTLVLLRNGQRVTDLNGIFGIDNAVAACKASGLEGWPLVGYAQGLVSAKMAYSYCNSWDSPTRAFKRGLGYCWQQTGALYRILEKLGVDSHMVYATRTYFPDRDLYSGHVWLKVVLDGEMKDVCPGNKNNTPGKVVFQVLSAEKEWNMAIAFFSYFGSAWLNAVRYGKS
ncbi:MAG: hypothetical protein VB025_16350 [Sphaerochaeta sp.]|nr:hypothetical protein [Sphaerochaeta sp.]PKL26232.1 MAG: hypothetical protein CVV46_15415 [Spirochaetae bacterium HGW-Spirochaetae-2]